ncbi:MAG: hypothetical protein WBL68_12860 [Nitrososphaeraceae archaeon]
MIQHFYKISAKYSKKSFEVVGHLEDSNELSFEIRHGRLVMTPEAIKELKNDIR